MNIHFEKANLSHKDTIFNWLKEPHVQEFWDNSQEHKDDILNFINGRIKPSSYADGLYTYWIGCIYNEPYCLVMTLQEKQEYSIPLLKKAYLSKHGHTYSMDYTIGNIAYFGKGLGAKTLEVFIDFIRSSYAKLTLCKVLNSVKRVNVTAVAYNDLKAPTLFDKPSYLFCVQFFLEKPTLKMHN